MPCSNECASSCTSSHGMPKTCTRKASIRRWRVTMRLADCLADLGEAQALALVAHDEAVVHEAPHHLERGRLRDADGAGQVGLRGVDARFLHPEELLEVLLDGRSQRSPCARVYRAAGRCPGRSRYRRGGVGTSREHGAHARRGLFAVAALAAVAVPRSRRSGRRDRPPAARAGRPGATARRASRAPPRRSSRSRTRKRLKLAWSRPLGGVGAAQPLYLSQHRDRRQAPRHLRHRERVGPRSPPSTPRTGAVALEARARLGHHGLPADAEGHLRRDRHAGLRPRRAASSTWRRPTSCGRSTCTPARCAAAGRWRCPIDQYHEHVWGAIALGNGHVYFGIASYCDRRPYSGRVLSVSTKSGAVDHSWTVVSDARRRRPAAAASGAGAASR